MAKERVVTPIPRIPKRMDAVKLPVTGTGTADEVAVAVMVGFGVADGVGLKVGAKVWDGVASKAGASPACTIKFLVSILVIPAVSIHEMVTLWGPGARSVGGLHVQVPSPPIVTSSVTGFSDSTIIVMDSPLGPLPKKAGCVLVTVSPSLKLSRITLLGAGEPPVSVTSNLDSLSASAGSFMSADGF